MIRKATSALVLCLFISVTAHAAVFNIADLNKDGIVDFGDMAIIAENWLQQTIFEQPDIEFVSIPAGTFRMGDESGSGRDNEKPIHNVTLAPFGLSKYQVTNKQYALFLNAARVDGLIKVIDRVVYSSYDTSNTRPYLDIYTTGSTSRITYDGSLFGVRTQNEKDMNEHPVILISWYGAKAFCDYYGYRLPTEAEWEYAARGGHDPYAKYPWGTDIIDEEMLNYDLSNPMNLPSTYTSTVGFYNAYGYGLCDMSGNVFEWCSDWHSDDYYGISVDTNPPGPQEGTRRVLRGGSWLTIEDGCRVAFRFRGSPYKRFTYCGFRPVRDMSYNPEDWPKKIFLDPPDTEFIPIPAGSFRMGDESGAGRDNEKPIHTVTLSSFELSKFEVTNKQYAFFLNSARDDGLIEVVDQVVYDSSDTSNSRPYLDIYTTGSPSRITYDGSLFAVRTQNEKDMNEHPVILISWYGAKAFCDYYGYRLPTEAEWEYAARGDENSYARYLWGSNIIDEEMLNYDLNNPQNLPSTYTSTVGFYNAYGYGLCDMSGNVFEWCSDWYSESYYDTSQDTSPPGADTGTRRILRGGSWLTIDNGCRVAYRFNGAPYKRYGYCGFRPARDPAQPQQ